METDKKSTFTAMETGTKMTFTTMETDTKTKFSGKNDIYNYGNCT